MPGDICLVWQKAFGGKHKIGNHWDIMMCMVATQQLNLPMSIIKPLQEVERTHVVHCNLLMHITPSHRGDEMQSEYEDSEYDTPPGDEGLSGSMPNMTWPVTWNRTRAFPLGQSIWDV